MATPGTSILLILRDYQKSSPSKQRRAWRIRNITGKWVDGFICGEDDCVYVAPGIYANAYDARSCMN